MSAGPRPGTPGSVRWPLLSVLLLAVLPLGALDPPPDPPRDVKAEALSPTRVRVTWRRGKDGSDPAFYRVLRDGEFAGWTWDDPWIDRELTPWTVYSYRVVAVDARFRESEPSDSVHVRTPDDTPPGAPGRPVAVAATDVSLWISWPAAEDAESGIAAYVVERDGKKIAEPATPELLDERLESSRAYTYRVRAINGAGEKGPVGPEAEIRTLDPVLPRDTIPPAPPSGLRLLEGN